MKTNKIFKTKNILFILTVLCLTACTKLDEVVMDEVLGANASSPEGALAAAYDRLGDGTFVDNGGMIAMQEYSSDIALLATRGSDWGDGGKWRAMHEYTWAPDNAVITSNWDMLTNGITKSLNAIKSISDSNIPEKTLLLAEAKGLLAFYTYTTLDLYNQAPYRNPLEADAPLEILQAPTAIDQLIKQVEALIPDLADLGTKSTHNGRFTKQAAYAFLAQMYLNRAVFKDRYNATSAFNFNEAALDNNGTDMDKVISYSNLLINSGKFSLESNYFQNFALNNAGGKELIFVIVQKIDLIRNGDNDLAYMSVERNQRVSKGNRGTNGSCITPEFYESWNGNHDDPRFQRKYQYADGTWFMNDGTDVSVPATSLVPGTSFPWFHFNSGIQVGQQYGPVLTSTGALEMLNGRIKVSKLFMEKSTATPMDFTPDLNFDNATQSVFAQNQINRGARCFKFEFDPGDGASNGSSGVDIPLFRLGGIYTMRAEAFLRKGDMASALADVNSLRTSRTRESLYGSAAGTPITAINADILYKEIGFEMYWEMWRRPQMVRFGKIDLALPKSAKPATQPFRRAFPIPQSTIDVTKAFKQNLGY